MRIHADLDLVDSQFTQTPRLRLANHDCVRLQLYIEEQSARIFDDLEKITAHQHFTTTNRKKKNSGLGKLREYVLDLCRRHLAVIVVVKIAVHAALVAAIGNIQVHTERNAQI